MKQKIVDEIFERVMEAVRNAFIEEDDIAEKTKQEEGISEDTINVYQNNNMILDLIESRVSDAIHETIDDMVDDGDITINES